MNEEKAERDKNTIMAEWLIKKMCFFDVDSSGKVKTTCKDEWRHITTYGASNITFPPGAECACPDCGKAAVPSWATPVQAIALVGRWQKSVYREVSAGVKRLLFDCSYRDRHEIYRRYAPKHCKIVNVRKEQE